MTRAVVVVLLVACGSAPPIRFDEAWPAAPSGYDAVTATWTRKGTLHGQYQEVVDLRATFKSPDWRAAHAARQADQRGLRGLARDQWINQAKADMAGPYEFELLMTTWDRRENDLDRGKKSVWHLALVGDDGREIEPIDVTRDRRPLYTIHAEYPDMGDFAYAYVVHFPRTIPILGPHVHAIRLRMAGERGAVELVWSPN